MDRPWRWLLVSLLFALAFPSQAATLQVSPVRVDFAADQNAAGLGLRNPGDAPMYGQVRVFRWDQNADGDQLTPATEVVASPPLIKVDGHGGQFIRLVRVDHRSAAVEQSYRVLIDEIPAPDAPEQQGIAIRMRYSIPLFIAPDTSKAQADISWQLQRQGGKWLLTVNNRGNRHAQIGALSLTTADGRTLVVSEGLLGYALPGRERQWPVPAADKAGALNGQVQLKVDLDGRASAFTVIAQG